MNENSSKNDELANKDPIRAYRAAALSAARGLHYGDSTEAAIWKAESEAEIARIMNGARHRKFG